MFKPSEKIKKKLQIRYEYIDSCGYRVYDNIDKMKNIKNQELKIPIILDKMDWENYIKECTNARQPSKINNLVESIKSNLDYIEYVWWENPTKSLIMLLANEDFLLDFEVNNNIDAEIFLIEKEICNFEELNFWCRRVDENGNKLPEKEWVPLHKLSNPHIKRILALCNSNWADLPKEYKSYFNKRVSK